MTDVKTQCPECQGKGVIAGTCVCNMEWRGTMTDNGLEDCRCEEEVTCPTCRGTGEVETGKTA